MQNRAIEIHDSIFDGVAVERGHAVLRFSTAYIHSSEGRPGEDAGSGRTQQAKLLIRDPVINGSFSDLPRDLDNGFIKIGNETFHNLIPIPLDHKGSVEIQIKSQGEVLSIHGSQATLELLGGPTYVEEFKPWFFAGGTLDRVRGKVKEQLRPIVPVLAGGSIFEAGPRILDFERNSSGAAGAPGRVAGL